MKKIFAFICILASLCLASCMSDSGSGINTMAGYFTIEGSKPNYTLYGDDGYLVVKLDPTTLPGNDGLDKNKRGFFYVQYDMDKVQNDAVNKKTTITNGTIVGGEYLTVMQPMTTQEAAAKKVTAADSTFEITAMAQPWYSRGYITTQVKSYYMLDDNNKGIRPTFNFVYDQEKDITQNTIKYTIHSNRHPKKSSSKYGPEVFNTTCYVRYDLMGVPGNDSITVIIAGNGVSDMKFKVARRDI